MRLHAAAIGCHCTRQYDTFVLLQATVCHRCILLARYKYYVQVIRLLYYCWYYCTYCTLLSVRVCVLLPWTARSEGKRSSTRADKGKKGLKSSRDKSAFEGKKRSGEGGGKPAMRLRI